MAILHLNDDAAIEAYLDAAQRDADVLAHVRGCDTCLAKVRTARRDRVLLRAALESARQADDHLSPEVAAAFCDEGLDDDTTRAVAAHLARCAACLDDYRDLVDALPTPEPVGATAGREVTGQPYEANTLTSASHRASRPAIVPAELVPTPGTFGTVFITRFAEELRLTFVTTPDAHSSRSADFERGSGDRPSELYDARALRMRARVSPSAPSTRRVELRSRSFSTVMRDLATPRRELPRRSRPTLRLDLPGLVAMLELVDLHDREVDLSVQVLRMRGQSRRVDLHVPATTPLGRDERLRLSPPKPVQLASLLTPATLTFEMDDQPPVSIEVRSLVSREPTT